MKKEIASMLEIHRYPTPNRMYRNYLIDKLLIELNPLRDSFFLEIGCGTGEFLAKMWSRGYRGWGIDIEDCSIQIAKNRLSNTEIKVFREDIMSVEGSFDIVFAFEVFEHIDDDIGALRKVNQLLKDKGYFMLSVPGRKDIFSETDIAFGHIRRYEREELIQKFQKTGFKILTIWSWGLPLLSKIYSFVAKREKKQDCNTLERTKKSGYSRPASLFIKKAYPLYSKFFMFFKLQNLFLNSDFLNCNYLVLCQKSESLEVIDVKSKNSLVWIRDT